MKSVGAAARTVDSHQSNMDIEGDSEGREMGSNSHLGTVTLKTGESFFERRVYMYRMVTGIK